MFLCLFRGQGDDFTENIASVNRVLHSFLSSANAKRKNAENSNKPATLVFSKTPDA